MTQPVKVTDQTQESVGQTTSDSGLRRLHPADGLFLRAEHLQQIQDYARELSRIGAIAAGTGVAYGFELSVDGSKLQVKPGLAYDPSGQPLRSLTTVTLDLSKLTVRTGRFWVVEVASALPEPAGSEPVFGELCADPCVGGSSIQPWLDNAVLVQVAPNDTLPTAVTDDWPWRRNSLASAYFDQERRSSLPWLTPGAAGTVAPLLSWPWKSPVPRQEPAAGSSVPLGVLLLDDEGRWVLDVWTARRDLMTAPARIGWEGHLGWRPWHVFLAQVLQFQAQLADTPPAAKTGTQTVTAVETLEAELLSNPRRSRQALKDLFSSWLEQHKPTAVPESLLAQGFRELPPAGFLPEPLGAEDLEGQLQAIFDPVPVTVRHATADAALRAVGEAQHLDRIPLKPPGGGAGDADRDYAPSGSNPAVEVWIPDVPADLPAVYTPSYGWVAFVRARECCVAVPSVPAPDQVAVYTQLLEERMTLEQFAERLQKEFAVVVKAGAAVATLTYPAAEWAVPQDQRAQDAVQAAYDALVQQAAGGAPSAALVGVVGSYRVQGRRPLALARAELLAVSLGDAFAPQASRASGIEPILLVPAPAETIWLVFTARKGGVG